MAARSSELKNTQTYVRKAVTRKPFIRAAFLTEKSGLKINLKELILGWKCSAWLVQCLPSVTEALGLISRTMLDWG